MNGYSRRSLLKAVTSISLVAFLLPGRAKADQPRMQAALDALGVARRELTAATEDKGGHRAKAMKLVTQAINQVELGLKYDRRH